MKKTVCKIFTAIMLLSMLTSCSDNQKTDTKQTIKNNNLIQVLKEDIQDGNKKCWSHNKVQILKNGVFLGLPEIEEDEDEILSAYETNVDNDNETELITIGISGDDLNNANGGIICLGIMYKSNDNTISGSSETFGKNLVSQSDEKTTKIYYGNKKLFLIQTTGSNFGVGTHYNVNFYIAKYLIPALSDRKSLEVIGEYHYTKSADYCNLRDEKNNKDYYTGADNIGTKFKDALEELNEDAKGDFLKFFSLNETDLNINDNIKDTKELCEISLAKTDGEKYCFQEFKDKTNFLAGLKYENK